MMQKEWDVFISHASEDKVLIAEPLADALRRAGIRVWLDKQELKIGDSLSERIDEGLANSRFGIVILSNAFFSKHWPRKELAGLRAREEDGKILPIWHKIDRVDVAKHSPILADVLAVTTDSGIENVASEIIKSILSHAQHMSMSSTLLNVLSSPPDRHLLAEFLSSTLPNLVCAASRSVRQRTPNWAKSS